MNSRAREDYERQLAEKNKERSTNNTRLSFRASIEDIDLQIFIAAVWIDADSIAKITEAQIRGYPLSCCENDEEGENVYLINEAVSRVTMMVGITDAKDRV